MLIAVAGLKGSPGVTSTALALAAVWPRPVVLVEADPTGSDLVYRTTTPDGYPLINAVGLVTLAAAVRTGVPPASVVEDNAQPLGCGVNAVVGVEGPVQARGIVGLYPIIGEACQFSETDVIVDLGRLERTSPTMAIATRANHLLLVSAPTLESVMHLTHGLRDLVNDISGIPVTPVLVVPEATGERDCADLDQVLVAEGLQMQGSRFVAFDRTGLGRLHAGIAPSEKGSKLARTAGQIASEILQAVQA